MPSTRIKRTNKGRMSRFVVIALLLGVVAQMCGCGSHRGIERIRQQRIEGLIRSINQHPDPLHLEVTPAVRELVEIGPSAIPLLLEVQLSDLPESHMRAQTALEGITMRMYGFQPGQGWRPEDEARWRGFWADLGSLNWQDDEPKRQASVALWRQWLEKQ